MAASDTAKMKTKPGKPRFIFVVGAPGAGKGTLSKRLAEAFGYVHISVGDLLRETVSDPATSDLIRGYVERGELVPGEHLFPIIKAKLRDCVAGQVVILDGFPRQLGQVEGFEKEFGEPLLVLFFNCPRDLAKGRVLGRQEGRAGDTSDMFEKRFKEYINLNPEILDYYGRDRGKLLEVDTSRDSDTSYGNLLRLLQTRREWLMLLAEDTYQP